MAPYAICSCQQIDFVCILPDAVFEADHQMLSVNKYIVLTLLIFNLITKMVRLAAQSFVLSLHCSTTNLCHSHHRSDTNFSICAV